MFLLEFKGSNMELGVRLTKDDEGGTEANTDDGGAGSENPKIWLT